MHRLTKDHIAKVNEEERKDQLENIDLETREKFVDQDRPVNKKSRMIKLILLLVSAFLLSIVAGILISEFMGPGGIVAGLLIGVSIGVVITLPPIIILITGKKFN